MDITSPQSPFAFLTFVTTALRRLLGELVASEKMTHALMMLVDRRLSQISWKITRLAERFAAGTLRAPVARAARLEPPVERETSPRPPSIWPRKQLWLVVMEGYRSAGCGGSIRHILVQPDMIALLQATPQAARIMRPLCRMLGVETALLYPGAPPKPVVEKVAKPKRVRAKREPIDWGRIPLPRGVISAIRRERRKKGW